MVVCRAPSLVPRLRGRNVQETLALSSTAPQMPRGVCGACGTPVLILARCLEARRSQCKRGGGSASTASGEAKHVLTSKRNLLLWMSNTVTQSLRCVQVGWNLDRGQIGQPAPCPVSLRICILWAASRGLGLALVSQRHVISSTPGRFKTATCTSVQVRDVFRKKWD